MKTLFIFVPFLVATAFADVTVPNEIDLALVRDFFRPAIRHLDHEVYVYNWRTAPVASNGPNQLRDARDSRGLDFARAGARAFWKGWGFSSSRVGGVLGIGLYAATDPVATRGYGGTKAGSWILSEFRLPEDLTVLDLKDTGKESSMSVATREAMSRLGCPADASENLYGALIATSTTYSAACRANLRRIIDGDLRVDAIEYSYHATNFIDCPALTADRLPMSAAFVLVNDRWMSADRVRTYNSTTVSAEVDRMRIQSLFLRHASELGTPSVGLDTDILFAWADEIVPKLYPGFTAASLYFDDGHGLPIGILNASTKESRKVILETAALRGYPEGPTFRSGGTHPLDSVLHQFGYFLWSDLDRQNVPRSLTPWMQDHLFGCGPLPTFKP